MFRDRADAGRQLAETLSATIGKKDDDIVVLALPRGGVPVAAEIAKALGAPLDLVLVRKIGHPSQPELALGAVADGDQPHIFVNQDVAAMAGISRPEIEALTPPLLAEIERRRKTYLDGRAPLPVKGKTAIVVDDGAATGATFKMALEAIAQQEPARVIAALPVAPPRVAHQLEDLADEVICLLRPDMFAAVGQFYQRFLPVEDAEVVDIMKSVAEEKRP